MLDVPSRAVLSALAEEAGDWEPRPVVGLARAAEDGSVAVLYSYSYGIGQYVLAPGDLPDAFRPGGGDIRHAEARALAAPERPIEWHLSFAGVSRVVSTPIPGLNPPARLWIGYAQPPPDDRISERALESAAARAATLLQSPHWSDSLDVLQRLEAAAGLLPVLGHVLDVRDIFDRLSGISRDALPHDMLTLGMFSGDLTTLTMYAQSATGPDLGKTFPQPYPPAVVRAWDFDIIDDRLAHPLERDRPPTRAGMRSSVRLAIRFDGAIVGGLGFMAREASRYTSADLVIGRRLADLLAVALSHHRIAGQLAEPARRNEELRARAAQSELLDDALASVTSAGELPDVFDRISSVTQRVLGHDAVVLAARLPDGKHGKVYAGKTSGPVPFPDVLEVPPALQANPDWEFDIVADLQARPEQQHLWLTRHGYRSVLRLPIRLDNAFVGGVSFLSFAPDRYSQADLPVARRITERIALSFARERGAALLRQADEASAAATRLEARVRALTDELDARTGLRRILGESPVWLQVLKQATQVASTDTTVLLLGESGTGKEVIARFLHRASSRNGGPFVALNCAALPEQLLEAELFGYERGAYTGAVQSKPGQLEQAAGGTLFLDEVGEMSLSAQAKFLRVLQEREFQRLGGTRVLRTDARIVAATNRDLQKGITQGQFREDLYYRLNVFAIRLPPLRDRRDDILPLSEAFLNELGRSLGRPPGGISREARQMLLEYQWPGNVRELRNILERAAILCDSGLITSEHLAFTVHPPLAPSDRTPHLDASSMVSPAPVGTDLHALERAAIEGALKSARFNKSKAAKALGLSRHQLYIRMQRHGLD
jgi:transcriptional regulator with GAF, ATPase, and Fis domain